MTSTCSIYTCRGGKKIKKKFCQTTSGAVRIELHPWFVLSLVERESVIETECKEGGVDTAVIRTAGIRLKEMILR